MTTLVLILGGCVIISIFLFGIYIAKATVEDVIDRVNEEFEETVPPVIDSLKENEKPKEVKKRSPRSTKPRVK